MWWKVIALVGVALAAVTTRATAASLPLAASVVSSAQASTPTATDSSPSPFRDAAVPSIAPPRAPSRLHLGGQKWVAPQLQRSEAGITWSLTPKVTLELNYERSAMAPMMPHDHDDGILTRLKLGF